ncbi:MAG: hypothetical protein ACRYF0_21260 [Janthinobacterium lividum]
MMRSLSHSARRLGWGLLTAGLSAATARAQAPDSLAALGSKLQYYGQQVLTEKLYLHLDRPAYLASETMWFKAYATEGTSHKPLAMSKVAYIEVLNQQQQPVLQTSISLKEATGQGSLVLPTSLPTGRYLVRAYTSWMKNFGPEFYFQTPVTIVNTLVAVGARPAAAAPGYDIQFFPEGGELVQGLTSKVAFRVANAAGRGLAATGSISDEHGAVLATFSTLKFGLGSFALTPPEAGKPYAANVRLADGTTISARLPAASARGYVMQLQEAGPKQLRISVATKGMGAEAGALTLLGHSGGRVAMTQTLYTDDQHKAVFLVSKPALLSGVSHFTLFNSRRQPVGERLYFQRPAALPLTVAPAKTQYGPREKVGLRLALPAAAPAASLSVAVYQLDSLAAGAAPADISSTLNLTADLKGLVENPAYYLRDSTRAGREAADNLMLTHGWSRFRWDEVLAGKLPTSTYAPELNGPFVQGRVLTDAGQPAPGILTYLASPGHNTRFYTSTSTPSGLVQFEVKDLYGSHKLILQTDWRRDSTYRLELFAPFSTQYAPGLPPPPLLAPTLVASLGERHVQAQVQRAYFGQHQQYGLPAHDTTAFYGAPTEQYRLDDFTRFKVLEEVLREYVLGVAPRQRRDGLHFLVMDTPHHVLFQEDPLTLLDGVPLFDFKQLAAFDPLQIKHLAVLTNRYYYGSQSYSGIVSYSTYKNNLGGFRLPPRALLETYDGLQGQREFFAPRYDTPQQQQSPLADLRNLLYWNPDVKLQQGHDQQLEFYTSDQPGRYLVVVQGLATDGQCDSTSTVLEVKPTL